MDDKPGCEADWLCDKLLGLSVPQFPHLQNGIATTPASWSWGAEYVRTMPGKRSASCLARARSQLV